MTYYRYFLLAGALAFMFLPANVMAEDSIALNVAIDQARIIRLQRDAVQIIVGNPAIADVAAQDSRLLVVTGKSFGTTNLIALDQDGAEIFSTQLAVSNGASATVTLYSGTIRRSYHCVPDCQRTLSIGDDKSQFDDLAQAVERKFGVVNSAIGGQ
ncbi:MAG TPA: pilus assembly protein N-terminal domain-containing protein [Hyphomicrobiales bacterium]|nr:pilus assembly protein N-terminal domain-containing protein [Hyphomicrobiales bacterium]